MGSLTITTWWLISHLKNRFNRINEENTSKPGLLLRARKWTVSYGWTCSGWLSTVCCTVQHLFHHLLALANIRFCNPVVTPDQLRLQQQKTPECTPQSRCSFKLFICERKGTFNDFFHRLLLRVWQRCRSYAVAVGLHRCEAKEKKRRNYRANALFLLS